MRGGGVNTQEVFYNFTGTKVTKLKVKIKERGKYGLGFIDGDISWDKPTHIDWGYGNERTTLTTPITNWNQANDSNSYYAYYSEPGEYVISIDGWYNYFRCDDSSTYKSGVTKINKVLTEIIQVSSFITKFDFTFENCSKLTSIPPRLFDKNISVTSFNGTFARCSSLTNIPFGLFDNGISVKGFKETFYDCSSLASIPSGLFNNNKGVISFYETFMNCFNLTGETPYTKLSDDARIKLWDRDEANGFVKPTSTTHAFLGCTNLEDYELIPDAWK